MSASITKVAEANFPTRWGKFRIMGFEGYFGTGGERRRETAVALVIGDIHGEPPLVGAFTPSVLPATCLARCVATAGNNWKMSLAMIAASGTGVLLYEQQEGRGIGLMAKLQAYELQDRGLDTVEANLRLGFEVDCRHYTLPVEVLKVSSPSPGCDCSRTTRIKSPLWKAPHPGRGARAV